MLTFIFLFSSGCGNTNNQFPANKSNVVIEKPSASESLTSDVTPGEINAEDLIKEYKANESAADAKYKGKPLEVFGRLIEISDKSGSLQAEMKSSKEKETDFTVKCVFAESERKRLSYLAKDNLITFRGTGNGMNASGHYLGMTDCTVK